MRTFALLQEKDIISNQRGIGFFVAEKGKTIAKKYMLESFINNELKSVFRKMEMLNLEVEDIEKLYSKSKKQKRG